MPALSLLGCLIGPDCACPAARERSSGRYRPIGDELGAAEFVMPELLPWMEPRKQGIGDHADGGCSQGLPASPAVQGRQQRSIEREIDEVVNKYPSRSLDFDASKHPVH